MRAIIIGAGSAGRNLAARLCLERYDVVVVDRRAAPLHALEEQFDILTVAGNGASPRVLDQAGVEKADLLIAVTNSDEVNILACGYARSSGVAHRVARVTSDDFDPASAAVKLRDFGVDLMINPKRECALELASLLQWPGASELVDLLDRRVFAISVKVSADSPMCRCALRACPQPDLIQRMRFVAVQRGRDLMIPQGDTQLMVGDDVTAVGDPAGIPAFLDLMFPDRPVIRKAVIAGGGGLGLTLARLLEETPLDIVLLERNPEIASACSGVLTRALVLRGDVMDEDVFAEARLGEHTAFISATGDDENNIISCLLAQKRGVSLTIGKVSKPEYVPVINSLSLLDRAVSPNLSMLNAILHFVRGRNVRAASLLHTLPGELLEVVLPGDNAWVGLAIKDLRLPKGAIIATMERGGRILVPTGEVRLEAGDRLVIYALPGALRQLNRVFDA